MRLAPRSGCTWRCPAEAPLVTSSPAPSLTRCCPALDQPAASSGVSPLESALWYNKCVDLLTVSVTARESAGEPYTLVELAGEADVTNTDELWRLLDEEVSQQPRTLIIDLSGLRFLDSSALHALLRVNRSMDRQGGVLALVSPQPAVAKILRLTTADRLIPVFDSVADAAAG
jgi:anti-sigma B factor antagonist